jgi:3-oxoadipate enol-lactonase
MDERGESMPLLNIHGANLYYERHGEGPPLVFAHGVAGNHLSWWQQVPYFRELYTCIIFDHPGFLQSEAAASEYSFVDSLTGLLDALGYSRVSLVAQSMGGFTCFGFALRFPQRVEALVMADTVFPLDLPEFSGLRAGVPERRAALEARGIHPAAGERMAIEQPALHFLYQEIEALNGGKWSPANPPPGSALVPRVGREGLRGYTIPTLFIIGEEDAANPPRLLEVGAAAVPGAKVARVPNAGHSVYFERPLEFNRIVDEWLGSVSGSTRPGRADRANHCA